MDYNKTSKSQIMEPLDLQEHAFGELEEEFKYIDRIDNHKKIYLIATLIFVLGGSGVATVAYNNSKPVSTEDNSIAQYEDDSSSNDEPSTEPENDPSEEDSSSQPVDTTPVNQHIAPSETQSEPAVQSFDKTSFVRKGRSVIAHYNQIVGLVTFGPSTPENKKITNIKNAYALDGQYSNEVIDFRALVSQADSTPSKYLEIANTAEDAVAAISVGVYEMNQWANGSSTSSLDSANIMISKGTNSLLQFSEQLNNI